MKKGKIREEANNMSGEGTWAVHLLNYTVFEFTPSKKRKPNTTK